MTSSGSTPPKVVAEIGFQIEGRIRRAVRTLGEYHDEFIAGITAEEFRERDALRSV